MNRQGGGRRRIRKRKAPRENSRMNLRWIIGIMILAVILGYLTARFIVGPLIGYDADESPTKITGQTDETEDDAQSGETEQDESSDSDTKTEENSGESEVSAAPSEGYALQFGAFSTKEGAEQLVQTLKKQGIDTEIVKADSVFKVIGPVVDTKEEALESLEKIAESEEVSDVFVAAF